MQAKKGFKYFVAIPVWGASYVDTFLNSSLPTLLAEGNLPFLYKNCQLQVCIYTSEQDADKIANHPLIQELQANTEVVIHRMHIPLYVHYESEHKYRQAVYNMKSLAYKDNISRAGRCQDAHGVIVSLNADIVFSSNFFAESLRILQCGKKVIEVVGPRGKANEIKSTLNNYKKDGKINISGNDLLNVWVENFHPLLNMHVWDGDSEIFNCSHLLWKVPNSKGWLARCFYLYPIIIMHPDKMLNFSGTIDQSLVKACGYDIKDSEVITKQNQMFCCELSEEIKFVGNFGLRNDFEMISELYVENGDPYNIGLLAHQIELGTELDTAGLATTIHKSDLVVNRIIRTVKAKRKIIAGVKKLLTPIRKILFLKTQLPDSLGSTV